MEHLLTAESLIAFLTLCALELVLGIDNIIFISILSGKLPADQQQKARTTGLLLAVITRILLLLSLSWVIGLTAPLFAVLGQEISGRDLILIVGGLFLIAKSTHEIHHKLEGVEETAKTGGSHKFSGVILQILLLDLVFSLDSVITAIGMVKEISIMVAAVLVSTAIMVFLARPLSEFVDRHPTIKMLALSFLLLIGVTLMAEGFDQHVSKGYIYFAMAFSLFVEVLNIRWRKKAEPLHLRKAL
jgi:predicted tellurium resistance membrane protein TerC